MRKTRTVCISIFFALVLIPFVNFSTAAPPDYIGVQVGEEYSWKIHINLNNLQNLIDDMNETLDLTPFETMSDATIKANIEWISDEILGSLYDYTLINISITMAVPGFGDVPMTPPGHYYTILVLNNNTAFYINDTINAMNYETFPAYVEQIIPILIVPINLNWTQEVQALQALYSFLPEIAGATAEVYGNGFKITMSSQTIGNITLQQFEIFATWDQKGVFNTAKISYGGGTIISVNIGDEGEIPGYELPIIIGITTAVCIGVILSIRKKNRFKV